MNILYLTHPLNGLLMIGLGLGLGIFLTRRFRLGWGIWWVGGATFILSQVGHIPFNMNVLNPWVQQILARQQTLNGLPWTVAALYGISAGVFEEFARYAMYRWWLKDARSWRKGILAGAGHGGMEAILLGLLTLVSFFQVVALKDMDLSTLLPEEQISAVSQQIAAYWTLPWYDSLLGAVERLFTIPLHVAASVMVLQAFTRRKPAWLGLAVLWHALVDAAAVYLAGFLSIYLVEGILGLAALLNLGIIFALRQPEPEPPAAPDLPLPSIQNLPMAEIEENAENLENTRFS